LTNIRFSQEGIAETNAVTAAHPAAEMDLFHIEAEITSCLHDMSDDDLRSSAELHEGPVNDEQIELHIYTCFLIVKRTRSTEHLEQVIRRTKGWIAELNIDHPDYARRFRILGMMSAWMSQLSLVSEDVELPFSGTR
jgi:hypothetical protein